MRKYLNLTKCCEACLDFGYREERIGHTMMRFHVKYTSMLCAPKVF